MDLQLEGKSALVTGSSSGIGEAIAKALAAEGTAVVIHGRKEEAARRVVEEIRQAGGKASIALGDLGSDSEAQDVAAKALSAFGRVDILVNNAGAFPDEDSSWTSTTPQEWLDLYNSNVVSMVRLIRDIGPPMRVTGWGRIIQIASVRATLPEATQPNYTATKAANANMTVSLAKEFANSGVTVNTVSPGGTLTPTVEAMFRRVAERQGWETQNWDEIEKLVVSQFLPNPTGRLGRAEEIAHLVTFVCSPLAAYINGANVRVDGGLAPTVN